MAVTDASAVPTRGRVYLGHVAHIAGSPAVGDARAALVSLPDGALAVDAAGAVAWVGERRALPDAYSAWPEESAGFILPGFVDTHVHYPQVFSTDAFGGGQLLEWLERCIFPAERRLADPDFAAVAAAAFTRRRAAAGTTAAMVFGSAFPGAQDALFEASLAAGLRTVSGRGIQTVGSAGAAPLVTGEADAITLTRAEIDRWHGQDVGGRAADARSALAQVALVPRFSLSVTPRTFGALGELYDEVRGRGVYFHSHISENNRPGSGEVDVVRSVYGVENYLDTYDGRFLPGSAVGGSSLLGRRSILAHAVHCTDAELARMAETGTSLAHCPTSQLFLGSGTMPWRRTVAAGVTIGLGSDVGGGDEWLLSRVASDCFKVHMSEPGADAVSLGPAELLFTATLAGARALDQEDVFGNFDVGKQADFLLIDPDGHPPLADTLAHGIRSDDAETATDQTLFALLLGLRETAIRAAYVRGRRVRA